MQGYKRKDVNARAQVCEFSERVGMLPVSEYGANISHVITRARVHVPRSCKCIERLHMYEYVAYICVRCITEDYYARIFACGCECIVNACRSELTEYEKMCECIAYSRTRMHCERLRTNALYT